MSLLTDEEIDNAWPNVCNVYINEDPEGFVKELLRCGKLVAQAQHSKDKAEFIKLLESEELKGEIKKSLDEYAGFPPNDIPKWVDYGLAIREIIDKIKERANILGL